MSMKLQLEHQLITSAEIMLKAKLSVANSAAKNTNMAENFA